MCQGICQGRGFGFEPFEDHANVEVEAAGRGDFSAKKRLEMTCLGSNC